MTHPFTPEYIAMAKAAEEIQALKPTGDDEVGSWFGDEVNFVWVYPTMGEGPANDTWLPRLDQLLGMLGDFDESSMIAHQYSQESGWHSDWGSLKDWHELVLTYLMYKKRGKVWRDGQWVKV